MSELAEKRIGRTLRRRVDGEDIVQSVFRTVYRRIRLGQFELDDAHDLWRLLVRITLRKTCDAGRRHTATQRDIGFECHFMAELDQLNSLRARNDDAAIAETLESLFQQLQPPQYVAIVTLVLAGNAPDEVASRMNLFRRTVERALNRARSVLVSAAH